MIELRHLRYFRALAYELSFTRAAKRLHISQPPLTRQICDLEEKIKVQLFVRTSRRVELTPAGKAFLKDVEAIFERLDSAIERAVAIDQGSVGHINIGLSWSHFFSSLPRLIADFTHQHPKVSLQFHEMEPSDQHDALLNSQIDLGITRTLMNTPELMSTRLWADRVVVALPRRHPLTQAKQLRLSALQDEAFIMLKLQASAYAEHIRACCIQAGFTPKATHWVAQVPAAVSLVAAGMGVALIPESVSRLYPDLIHIVPLASDFICSEVYAVQRADDGQKAISNLVRFLVMQRG